VETVNRQKMTKVKVHLARQDIYKIGGINPKTGHADRSRPSKSDKEEKIVEKGQVYYSFTWPGVGRKYSLTPPTMADLQQSDLKRRIWAAKLKLCEKRNSAVETIEDLNEAIYQLSYVRGALKATEENMPLNFKPSKKHNELISRIKRLDKDIEALEKLSYNLDGSKDHNWISRLAAVKIKP